LIIQETTDPKLLQSYYTLREKAYREELGLEGFSGAEESADRKGKILVAQDSGEVFAGLRVTRVSSKCCLWSRLVVGPGFRSRPFNLEFLRGVIQLCTLLGYKRVMIVTGKARARYYRTLLGSLGILLTIHPPSTPKDSGAMGNLEHIVCTAGLISTPLEALGEKRRSKTVTNR
jgi:hypothetical protein